ncbi:MAG: Rieske 2Fe-2S domain-containing protein [Chloroflexota bacterium]
MASQAASVEQAGSGMSRREFLYYIWGASLALLTLEAVGLLIWFRIPRFREGEFGGKFVLPLDAIPRANDEPVNYADGRFWLVNLDSNTPNQLFCLAPDETEPIIGVCAIYKVCTHLGCIYAWTPANDRYECPCHGSKYRLDGRRIESPAPRTLDRFLVEALADDKSTVLASSELVNDFWNPLELPAQTAFISIDTGNRKLGPSQVLLSDFTNSCP